MNFANNIKEIRKENQLSQEQLAEKLGVSRQSVSKWESGQSYPEMEKILLICKLFNYDIGELMNENIKEVSETKESKTRVNKAIEDFFDYITRFVDMFVAMTFRQKLKCLFEQVFIAGALAVLSMIIRIVIGGIIQNIFGELNYDVYRVVYSVTDSIVMIVCLVLSVTILLHIFKIRYLDYYEIVKPQNADVGEEATDETVIDALSEENEPKRKTLFSRRSEKVIIRDPQHSSSKFLVSIMKAVVFFFKIMLGFIGLWFALSFVCLAASLVISFLFAKAGILFVGAFLCIASVLAVDFVVLRLIYNFIASKKSRKNITALILIISLAVSGIGGGLIFVGVTQFNVVNTPITTTTDFSIPMEKNLEINCFIAPVVYEETDSDEIKITVTHSKYHKVFIGNFENERTVHSVYAGGTDGLAMLRAIVMDINNKEINEYYFESPYIEKVVVYTSKANIEKLKAQ